MLEESGDEEEGIALPLRTQLGARALRSAVFVCFTLFFHFALMRLRTVAVHTNLFDEAVLLDLYKYHHIQS